MKTNVSLLLMAAAMVFFACEPLTKDPDKNLPVVPANDIPYLTLMTNSVYVSYTSAVIQGEFSIQDPSVVKCLQIRYGKDAQNLDQIMLATLNGSEHFAAELTGLEDGARYYFRPEVNRGIDIAAGETLDFVTFPEGPIDLDLPSGNKWASHNVGAKEPTAAGDYFAWGEVETDTDFSWNSYKWYAADYYKFSKYSTSSSNSSMGVADNKTQLDLEDDAARHNMGADWRMATNMEWKELIEQTDAEYAVINGVVGQLLRSKKDPENLKKCLFLPATGSFEGSSYNSYAGYYWTANVNSSTCSQAICVEIPSLKYSDITLRNWMNRCTGMSIRAILAN